MSSESLRLFPYKMWSAFGQLYPFQEFALYSKSMALCTFVYMNQVGQDILQNVSIYKTV